MFLKAGLLSLALLLASRVLGLARESAQAAAFGATGMADVVVLMFTLPDWIAGVAISGALAYVLVPAWAGRPAWEIARHQRKVAAWLLAGGVLAAAALAWFRTPVRDLLAAGVPPEWSALATQGLLWSAAALPMALLAALWATRLQHHRDFVGLYGANLVVNVVLIAAIAVTASLGVSGLALGWLGAGLLLAMLGRLLWQGVRMARADAAVTGESPPLAPMPWPGVSHWLWAMAAAGLPLAMPVVARSVVSAQGEGALAAFSYAWKLVELPLVLAIQLVATLAFPHVAAAVKQDVNSVRSAQAVRSALALAWTLACAAAAALLVASPAVARLLFGWGRMDASGLERIAAWAAVAAWGLLPQAMTAVAVTVLATQSRLKPVVLAYATGLLALFVLARMGLTDGEPLMWSLNAVYGCVALAAWWQLGRPGRGWLPAQALAAPFLAMLLVWASAQFWHDQAAISLALGLLLGTGGALLVAGTGWLAGCSLRKTVRA